MTKEILSGDIHQHCLVSGSNVYDVALEKAMEQLSIPLLYTKVNL